MRVPQERQNIAQNFERSFEFRVSDSSGRMKTIADRESQAA
jgi:hypothetical protein